MDHINCLFLTKYKGHINDSEKIDETNLSTIVLQVWKVKVVKF